MPSLLSKPPESVDLPFTDKHGNKFLIKFIHASSPLVDIETHVVEIFLYTVNLSCKPDLSTCLGFSKIISSYFEKYDVILYYMCDYVELNRSDNNKKHTPQRYRFLLFDKLAQRICTKGGYIKDNLRMVEKDGSEVLVTLITRKEHGFDLKILSENIILLGK